jgi:ribonuclease P protein component
MKETLKRNEILRNRRDINRVRRSGLRVAGVHLYLRYCPRPGIHPTADRAPLSCRVAFLLPRGIRGAVRRNRLKRRLRELYRRNRDRLPAGGDYLLHAAAGAADLSFDELSDNLMLLLGSANADLRA